MTTESRSAKDIFVELIGTVPPDDWDERLAHACQGDVELQRRVRALLRAHAEPGSFLEQPATGDDASVRPEPAISEGSGTVIGPYKLLEQIGEGGMGVVFMAEQSEPIQRSVALKIIKPGMDTRQVIARFEAERQALALMDHPNIACVLDAGATDTGRPYFVMELVKGVPITKYCDEKHLPLRARLELFVPVCQAVQHAHQKGIIHRDIKPNNVLVAEYDNRAVPKVIDFGVAKATAQKLTERTMFTEFGQLLGTMEYMSPEQSKFNQLDIDTRSDIYSLGVLLYELLAGSTPFEGKRLHAAAFDEMLRIIREEEPPKPSTRLSSSDALPSIAANRGLEPLKLNRLVQGELDWIVMKALEKDRNRRYETASGFAADIERHLHDEPVQACPPTWSYRLRKFVRRNKVGVLAGSAIALALTVGLILASVGFIQARRQAIRADHEAEIARKQEKIARTQAVRSEQVSQFLKRTFQSPLPWFAYGRDTKLLQDILSDAAKRAASELKEQPEVEAELLNVIGRTYWFINEYSKSETMHRRALALYRPQFGNEHPLVVESQLALARSLSSQGRVNTLEEAESIFRQALAIQRKSLGNESADVAEALRGLGDVLAQQHRLDEAERTVRESLMIRRKVLGNQSPEVADSLTRLALLLPTGREAEAEAIAREAVEILRKSPADSVGSKLYKALNALAIQLQHEEKLPEAEATLREALNRAQQHGGKGSSGTVDSLYRLMVVLNRQGKQADVEQLLHDYPIPSSGRDRYRADLFQCRGAILLNKDQLQEAESDFRNALTLRLKLLGKDNPLTTATLTSLIRVLQREGKSADAEQLLHEAEAQFQSLPPSAKDSEPTSDN